MKQTRSERRTTLQAILHKDPFLTDEELAFRLEVSVATIRLDRMALGIPELRERARSIASNSYAQVRSLQGKEIIGEPVDLKLTKRGTSVLIASEQMVFQRNNILRGHYLFAQGNSLAVALINSQLAVTKSASVNFLQPVELGARVVAEAKVTSVRKNQYTIMVESFVQEELVYWGEYVVVDVTDKGGYEHD